MKTAKLTVPPVGVKIYREIPAWIAKQSTSRGVSFCEIIAAATAGSECWVDSSSITTCRWSPVVLGLKESAGDFEQNLSPRLPGGTAGIYLARLDDFHTNITPDVVVLRTTFDILRGLLITLGWEHAAWEVVETKRIGKSALRHLKEEQNDWRTHLLKAVNRSLTAMDQVPGWSTLTAAVFKSRRITKAFDQIIKRSMADMSICRNSVVTPFITQKVNVSYFCTGAIAWGKNQPLNMAAGWPWPLWRQIRSNLSW